MSSKEVNKPVNNLPSSKTPRLPTESTFTTEVALPDDLKPS